MRFKASISKQNLNILHGAVSSLGRLSHGAALFLSPDYMRIALVASNADIPKCFVEFNQSTLFNDYRIESLSDNNLLFEISIPNFMNALASGKNSLQSVIKLVKRDGTPCLCVETSATDTLSVGITHDIPIRLMRVTEIVHYQPPDVRPPTVSLEIGRGNKLFRTVVDRMNRFSKHLYISAFQSGKMVLSIEHQTNALIKTHFTGLFPRFDALDREADKANTVQIKVDIRKLGAVLQFQNSVPWDSVVAHMSCDDAMVVHVELAPGNVGSMTYFLPIVLQVELDGGDADAGADLGGEGQGQYDSGSGSDDDDDGDEGGGQGGGAAKRLRLDPGLR